jgi:glycine cleavage system H protein
MEAPEALRYSRSHLWVREEGDGTVSVGITFHAQQELGDIVYVEPPAPGRRLAQEEVCGVIESVKTASDLHAPVAGEVTATNPAAGESPERINADPYGTWLFRMRAVDPAQVSALLDAAAYRALTAGGS